MCMLGRAVVFAVRWLVPSRRPVVSCFRVISCTAHRKKIPRGSSMFRSNQQSCLRLKMCRFLLWMQVIGLIHLWSMYHIPLLVSRCKSCLIFQDFGDPSDSRIINALSHPLFLVQIACFGLEFVSNRMQKHHLLFQPCEAAVISLWESWVKGEAEYTFICLFA